MKKRVLSLFMALMLCLTLLPTAALAAEPEALNGTPSASVADADAEAGAQNGGDAAGQDGEDGVSVQSGGDGIAVQAAATEKTESSVASVVIGGETNYYNTLYEAIAAAYNANIDAPLTVTLLKDGEKLSYPFGNSPQCPATIEMDGKNLSDIMFQNNTLILRNGTANGTVDIRSGGGLVMTAPADADAAIDGALKIVNTPFVGSGTANVSGAKIGVKGTLRVESSAANAVVISGSEKAVELSAEASLADNCRLYGSTEENGSPDTVAVFDADQKTYTVNGEIVKRLVSGPKAVVAVTPGDTLSVMAGEAQEYTAQFTADGVVTGSVKGLGDLQATVENGDANDITVNVAENAADGTWKVTVQTAESTPLGTYTLNLSSAVDGAVSGSVQFKVSETKYAASVGEQNYRSLSAAVEAAKATSGTVKLLDNVTGSVTVTEGNKFTIDLNGKTWTGTTDAKQALTVSGGEVTLTNSDTANHGRIIYSISTVSTITVAGGTLHLEDGVEIEGSIYINDNEYVNSNVTFAPGVIVTKNISASSRSIAHFLNNLALMDRNMKNYVLFYGRDTFFSDPLAGVVVVDHPAHHMVDGVCDQCGFACDHSKAEKGAAVCPDCKAKFIATATAADGTVTRRYTNADAALAAAAGSAKVTFVPGTYTLKNAVSFSGRIETEIDLNGATLQYASGDRDVVLLITETYENITITLKNGTVQNTGEGTGIGLYSSTQNSARSALTLENVTVIGGVDTFNTRQAAVCVAKNNTLTVKSGSFSGPLDLNLANNTVKLYGGTYQNGITGSMYRNGSWQYELSAEGYAALLDNSDPAKQYAYADGANGAVISYATVAERMNDRDDTNNSIRVVAHEHTMKDSACTQCGFVCTAHQYENGVCAICKAECPHANVDTSTRVCSDCRLTMVAAVTVKDSENNDVTTYAADLSDALDAAENGATVTLLADAAVGTVPLEGKTVTLDLNGKTVKNSGGGSNNILVGSSPSSASLIITGRGSFISESLTLVVKNGTLDLSQWTGDDSYIRNVTISGANSRFISPTGAGEIYTLAFTDSDTEQAADTASLNGGRYDEIAYERGKTIKLGDLLAKGHAFRQNGTFLEYAKELKNNDTVEEVEVVRCTSHVDANGDKLCDYCNTDLTTGMVATSETGGTTYYYTDLSAALAKVSTDGGTVKLLNNVTVLSKPLTIENKNGHNITLDLNGKTLQTFPGDADTFLQVLGNVTICDSSDAKSGKIESPNSGGVCVSSGTLTITGGTFDCPVVVGNGGNMKISGGIFAALETRNNTAVSTLLADGYTLKYNGGSWLTEEELARTTADQVTAEAAPLTSVAISVTPGTTVEYGQSVTLKLDYKTNSTGSTISHKWYSVDKNGTATEIPDANDTEYTPTNLSVGEHKYRVTATANDYSKSADITITVTPRDLKNATVKYFTTNNPTVVTYTYNPLNNHSCGLPILEVTLGGVELKKDTDYTISGNTAAEVGKYTAILTAKSDSTKCKGTLKIEWEVVPYALPEPIFEGSQTYTKIYDGTTTLPEGYKFQALFPSRIGFSEVDWREDKYKDNYEVTAAEFVSPDAGKNKPINQTITLKNANFVFEPTETINIVGVTTTDKTITYKNFTLSEAYPTLGTYFNIEKATMPDFDKEVTLDIVNNHADTYTVDLSALLPALEAPREYGAVTYGAPTVNLSSGYYTDGARVEDGKLILPIQAVKTETTDNIGSVMVKVSTTNYHDFTLTINVNATNKIVPTGEPTLSTETLTYGQALSAIKLSGKLHDNVNNKDVEGMFTWADGTVKPNAGSYEAAWKFTPTDGDTYTEADGTVTITVNKAKPTGDPIYTRITAAKKTLADAALKPNASWPTGTIQWVDKDGNPLADTTEVKANTEYQWKFIPADTANYNEAAGLLTPYSVSTGGGGGGGGAAIGGTTAKTDTVTNPDGSVTKTETKADGTVVETTTAKDGSTTVTETKKDGSSVTESKDANGSTGTVKTDANGQTEASAKISDKAVSDAKNSGDAVKVPTEVKAGTNSNSAPTVKVELPAGSGETKIEIPVSNVNTGTVAVIVHPDGTEEIVKDSIPTENGVQLTVNGDATVKVMDNSKNFTDTAGHWSEKNIDFVSARGLLNGTSANTFSPNAPTTRAQLWTVLARQADADLTGGANWYEKAQKWSAANGISDGTNPSGTISRAQMVAMLWRAAGSPELKAAAGRFSDVAASSYYADAVAWAVENGITTGTKDGRFDPYASCTRAQIAAFLYRHYLSR